MPRKKQAVLEDDPWKYSTFRQPGTVEDKNRRWKRCRDFLQCIKGLVEREQLPREPNAELEEIVFRAMESWRRTERHLRIVRGWGGQHFALFPNAASYDMLEGYAETMVEEERLSFRKDVSVIIEHYERNKDEAVHFDAEARDRLASTANRVNGRPERINKAKALIDPGNLSDRMHNIAAVAVDLGLRAVDVLAVQSSNAQAQQGNAGEARVLIRSNGKAEDKADRLAGLACGRRDFEGLVGDKTTLVNCCLCKIRHKDRKASISDKLRSVLPIGESELRTAMGLGGGALHSARRTALIGLTIAAQGRNLFFHAPTICHHLAWGDEAEMKGYTHFARDYARLPVMFATSLFATTRATAGCVGARRMNYIDTHEVEVSRQTKKGIMTTKQVRQRVLPHLPVAETQKKVADRTSYPLGGRALQGVLTAGERAPDTAHLVAPDMPTFFAGGLRGGVRRGVQLRAGGRTDQDTLDALISERPAARAAATSSSSSSAAASGGMAPIGAGKRRPGRPKKGEENPDGPKRRRKEKQN